ncbi:aminopeptidase N-like [Pseudomyrmex gracilis]|uniref:aminopeptidase N-like n=1 Tax=Pseudomyrmex gracilis TaxID=219809 RepID=UPI000994F608|nr:aminopeptidase N-like [Pseudomyrmex gracilis]
MYKDLSILDKLWYWNFEAFLNKFTYFSEDIKRILTVWTAEVGYPMLHVKQVNDTQVAISVIDCFTVDHKKQCELNWWIPVTVKRLPLTERYRVNYDRKSWKHIAFFLKNGDFKIANVHDVSIAQIVDDAFYFLVQNTKYNDKSTSDNSDLDIYLEIASSIFHANNSYIMWYPIFFALENMSKIFPFRETVVTRNIKVKLLIILIRFLDNISYTQCSENSINNQLYHEVLKWTCIIGDLKCKEYINGILEWHFKNPAQNKKYEDMYNFLYFLTRNFLPTPGSSLTANTNNTRNIITAKKSDTITVLFTILSLHSKNDSALNEIGFGLESGIVRDVNILPIINCIINNIYSNYDLSMITNEMFLQKVVHIYMIKEPYVLDAIKEKVEYRRNFLSKIQTSISYRLHLESAKSWIYLCVMQYAKVCSFSFYDYVTFERLSIQKTK